MGIFSTLYKYAFVKAEVIYKMSPKFRDFSKFCSKIILLYFRISDVEVFDKKMLFLLNFISNFGNCVKLTKPDLQAVKNLVLRGIKNFKTWF